MTGRPTAADLDAPATRRAISLLEAAAVRGDGHSLSFQNDELRALFALISAARERDEWIDRSQNSDRALNDLYAVRDKLEARLAEATTYYENLLSEAEARVKALEEALAGVLDALASRGRRQAFLEAGAQSLAGITDMRRRQDSVNAANVALNNALMQLSSLRPEALG